MQFSHSDVKSHPKLEFAVVAFCTAQPQCKSLRNFKQRLLVATMSWNSHITDSTSSVKQQTNHAIHTRWLIESCTENDWNTAVCHDSRTVPVTSADSCTVAAVRTDGCHWLSSCLISLQPREDRCQTATERHFCNHTIQSSTHTQYVAILARDDTTISRQITHDEFCCKFNKSVLSRLHCISTWNY